MWTRSTNKSNCMVCRRGSDPDKMLLCDECNGGTHMFCMKPKIKTVPEGNWYCNRCVARLGIENSNDKKNKKTQRNKRKFIVDEDISDAASVTSESATAKGRPSGAGGGGRGRNKHLQSHDIEELLDDDDDVDQDEDVDGDVTADNGIEDDENGENEDDEAEEDQDNENDEENRQSNNQSDMDE